MAFNNEIMVASGGDEQHPGEPTIENIPGGGGGGEGHVYDLEIDSTNENVTLTEDGADKTELPLVPIFTRTKEEWDQMTVAQKTKYRLAIFSNDSISYAFSHIGQIIESTTLDTEAKVKNVYGAHTSWIQHSGYVLRGAESGVTADQNESDGGADNVTPSGSFSGTAATLSHSGGAVQNTTLSLNQIPSHAHGGATGGMSGNNPHSHTPASGRPYFVTAGAASGNIIGSYSTLYGGTNVDTYTGSTDIAHTHSITAQGGGQAHGHGFTQPSAHSYTPQGSISVNQHNYTPQGSISMNEQSNLPKYKSIYIWERIA